MGKIKRYQFHIDDNEAKHGYKNVPVFLSEDGILSIEGYVNGYAHFCDLFVYSWEITGNTGRNKYSVFMQKPITDFLNKNSKFYIKKIVVGKDAAQQYYVENGCLVDNYHQEVCLITEECKELNLRNMKNARHIGEHAAEYWGYEGALVIPEKIVSIGKNAFYKSEISKLVFDGNPGGEFALEIKRSAFFMTEKLESVDFGTRKIKVFMEAFSYSHIINLDIPQTVEISEDGFNELRWAKNINIHCKKIPAKCFLSTGGLGDGCTINMKDVNDIGFDKNYNATFKFSKLNKVIINGILYNKLKSENEVDSWKNNIGELDILWHIDETGKILGNQKR